MPANFNFTSDADVLDDFVDQPRRKVNLAQVPEDAPDVSEKRMPVLDALNYDYDIIEIPPDPAQQAHLDALAALGQDADEMNIEARWRDPRTVAAVGRASRAAQRILERAGFGTKVSGSQLPAGRFQAEEVTERHEVVMRLTNLLSDKDAAGVDWGEFNCMAFFEAHAQAESIRTGPAAAIPLDAPKANGKRKFALAGLAVGIGLLVVAVFAAL